MGVLRRRLLQLRAQASPALSGRPRTSSKRPSLASRTRSSPQIRQFHPPPANSKRGVVIIHFTSLGNYSRVRDAVQSILTPGSASVLPEVMVIPKPVGPRRFLTALHTGVHRPIVDPFFTPIATSPLSPSGNFGSTYGYFPPASVPQASSPLSGGREDLDVTRPLQFRTASNNSVNTVASAKVSATTLIDNGTLHLSIPDQEITNPMDFLSDTANRIGHSARSGMLIQSPDGMPMGMFFDPAPRTPNSRRSSNATNKSKEDSDRRRNGGIVRPPIAMFTSSIDSMMKSTASGSSTGGGGLGVGGNNSGSLSRGNTLMSSSSHRSRHGLSDFDMTNDDSKLLSPVSGGSSTLKSSLRRTPSTEQNSSSLDRGGGIEASSSPMSTSRVSRSRSNQASGLNPNSNSGGGSSSGVTGSGIGGGGSGGGGDSGLGNLASSSLSHRASNSGQSSSGVPRASPLREEPPRLATKETNVGSSSSSGGVVGGVGGTTAGGGPVVGPSTGGPGGSPLQSPNDLPDPSKLGSTPKTKKKAASRPKKAAKKDDGMVVPPINVLIVEGQNKQEEKETIARTSGILLTSIADLKPCILSLSAPPPFHPLPPPS